MNELLTINDVAKYLKLKPATVMRKAAKGEIPATKAGRQYRFDRQQIDEWLRYKSTAKKRILVIDDEEMIRRVFKDTLQDSGYHVITSKDGTEALELVKSWNFDLIFLDLKMPEMNGPETFRQIRQINSSVPIVIITGYPISQLMEQALEQGPFGTMRKPFDASDIQRSADSFLRGARAKDNLAEGFRQLGGWNK